MRVRLFLNSRRRAIRSNERDATARNNCFERSRLLRARTLEMRPHHRVRVVVTRIALAATLLEVSLLAREARADDAAPVDVAPANADQEEEFGATARVAAPPREVTKRTLEAKELTAAPGTFGDALRAIEILPGSPCPPRASQPLIRGSNFKIAKCSSTARRCPFCITSAIFVARQFAAARANRILSGNFSTRYGRVSGGVIEVRPRDPRQDRWGGVVDVSLLDSSALVEGPIGARASMAFAARRSNVDLVFKSIAGSGDFDTIAAPVYYDYQYIASLRPTDRDRVRVMMYGSRDSGSSSSWPNRIRTIPGCAVTSTSRRSFIAYRRRGTAMSRRV